MQDQNGQTLIEYTLLMGIILTVIIAMQPMIKRAAQGMIKVTADQIGNQQEADQRAFYNTWTKGHMEQALVSTRAVIDTQTVEFLGLTNRIYGDSTRTDSAQQSNLGFSPEVPP